MEGAAGRETSTRSVPPECFCTTTLLVPLPYAGSSVSSDDINEDNDLWCLLSVAIAVTTKSAVTIGNLVVCKSFCRLVRLLSRLPSPSGDSCALRLCLDQACPGTVLYQLLPQCDFLLFEGGQFLACGSQLHLVLPQLTLSCITQPFCLLCL